MGRGDNRTKRGKISSGTFGVSRPARATKKNVSQASGANAAPKKTAKEVKG